MLREDLHYRIATAEDAPLLAGLNRQLIEDEGHRNPMTPPELERRMRDWLQGEYTAVIFELAGRPAAYALYRAVSEGIYLRQFFVDRAQRRAGIGRAAIDLLRDEIWPPGTRVTVEVLASNRRGYDFWRAVGFRDYAITLELM
jgi:GNAT superfamily N-acetyltransferase